MRRWYFTQLRHAQHNRNIDRLYKLYNINHRLDKLYLNTINYILPFTTSDTTSPYSKIADYISTLSLTRGFRVISAILRHLRSIATDAPWKPIVIAEQVSLSPTPSHKQQLHITSHPCSLHGTYSCRFMRTRTFQIKTVLTSTTRAPS